MARARGRRQSDPDYKPAKGGKAQDSSASNRWTKARLRQRKPPPNHGGSSTQSSSESTVHSQQESDEESTVEEGGTGDDQSSLEEGEIAEDQNDGDHGQAQTKNNRRAGSSSHASRQRSSTAGASRADSDVPPSIHFDDGQPHSNVEGPGQQDALPESSIEEGEIVEESGSNQIEQPQEEGNRGIRGSRKRKSKEAAHNASPTAPTVSSLTDHDGSPPQSKRRKRTHPHTSRRPSGLPESVSDQAAAGKSRSVARSIQPQPPAARPSLSLPEGYNETHYSHEDDLPRSKTRTQPTSQRSGIRRELAERSPAQATAGRSNAHIHIHPDRQKQIDAAGALQAAGPLGHPPANRRPRPRYNEVIDLGSPIATTEGAGNEQEGGSADGRPSNGPNEQIMAAEEVGDKESSGSALFQHDPSVVARIAERLAEERRKAEADAAVEKARQQWELKVTAGELLPTYVLGDHLGQGGFGQASVWVKTDANSNVIERFVMKYCTPSPLKRPRKHPNPPKEVQLLQRLAGKTPYTTRYRGHHLSADETEYWIVMDYCPFGDLLGLWTGYKRKSEAIPEAFLWYVMFALVQASIVMRYGDDDPEFYDGYTDDWGTEIVHGDMKPQNVFLGEQLPNVLDGFFGMYPAPVLGDFGCAVEVRDDNDWNPNVGGTRGYEAPESNPQAFDNIADCRYKRLAWTNVWGIGAVMATLIYQLDPYVRQFIQYNAAGDLTYVGVDQSKATCSQELTNCVRSCLQSNPENRPSLEMLFDRIDQRIESLRDHLINLGAVLVEMDIPWDRFRIGSYFYPPISLDYGDPPSEDNLP